MRLLFYLILTLLAIDMSGQSWPLVLDYADGSTTSESVVAADRATDGTLWMVVSYEGAHSFAGRTLPVSGGKDLALVHLDAQGDTLAVLSLTGSNDDRATDVIAMPDGGVVVVGTFRDDIALDTITLVSAFTKSAFVVKYSNQYHAEWAHKLTGNNTLTLTGRGHAGEAGEVYVTATYGGALDLGDTTLTASGDTDGLLLRYNADGTRAWFYPWGRTGDTRATCTAFGNGKLYVGGYFFGRVAIPGDTIVTNTQDEDVWLAAISPEDGAPIWLKKIGGPYADYLIAMDTDAEGRCYLAGHYEGVLRLADGVDIQTPGFNFNWFVACYTADGTYQWVRNVGGSGLEYVGDISVGERVLVCGTYSSAFEHDGNTLPQPPTTNGVIMRMLLDGNSSLVQEMASTNALLPTAILAISPAAFWVAGNYRGTADFDAIQLTAPGDFFDLFVAQFDATTVSVTGAQPEQSFMCYPNPATDWLQIEVECNDCTAAFYDAQGRLHYTTSERSVDVSSWPSGVYFVRMHDSDGRPMRSVERVLVR